MPGDLTVSAVPQPPLGPLTTGRSGAPGQTANPPPAAGAAASGTTSTSSTNSTSSGSESRASSLYANPVSELDPALGIVVLSFYNAEGVQTSSIPTQKQLESYRLHGEANAAGAAASGNTHAAEAAALSGSAD